KGLVYVKAKYTKALQSIVSKWEELTTKEFAAEYRNAFYTADKKGQKNTQRVTAIADPSLGEEWWKWAKSLQWIGKIVVMKDWLNLNHSACMYTEEQRVALWPKDVYKACPLFLDFPKDIFPPEEQDVFQEAEAQQITRQQQQGKNLRSLKKKEKESKANLEVEDEEDNKEWRPLNIDGETAPEIQDTFVQCNSSSHEEEEAPMIAINLFSVSNIESQSKISKLLLRVASRARQSFRIHGEKTKAGGVMQLFVICPQIRVSLGLLKTGFHPGIV
ncbi:hypothetical protein L7F22_066121, partial [Adiantum nelumboides]|nr:hypothetical protein [Adiantum nelumboides]